MTVTNTNPNVHADDSLKLSLLYSARIRLNTEEKASMKAAYQRLKAGRTPKQGHSIGGSTLTVETSFASGELDTLLGMSSIVFSDLINSRDSISLPLVLKMQLILGVEVVTKQRMEEAFKHYLEYVFNDAK